MNRAEMRYRLAMACPRTDGCPLFPLFSSREFLKTWQITYCETEDYGRCARYQGAMRGDKVAPTLLPNGKHLPLVSTRVPADPGDE